MSKINIVDAIHFLENVSFELMHSDERLTQIGSMAFRNDELNDNMILVVQMMKFIIQKQTEKYSEDLEGKGEV